MTIAAFLLECETCHDKIGLMTGAVEKFICMSCAADAVFGSGKDGTAGTTGSLTERSAQTAASPVPANPGGLTSIPPPNAAGASFLERNERRAYESMPTKVSEINARYSEQNPEKTYFGCPGLGEPGDEFYVAAHSAVWMLRERGPWPNALCQTCYGIVQKLKKAVGGR